MHVSTKLSTKLRGNVQEKLGEKFSLTSKTLGLYSPSLSRRVCESECVPSETSLGTLLFESSKRRVGCEVAGHNLGLAGSGTPESDQSDKGKMVDVTDTPVSAHRTESSTTASG